MDKIKVMLLLFFIVEYASCLFDEEIKMDKPIKGSALFFRRLNINEFYISNSVTNYIFNIRTGEKRNFTGIIPLESTIYEPFLLYVGGRPSYFIDADSINDYIKIYDINNNIYKEYTALKINDGFKRKFCKFGENKDNKFVVGVEDNKHNFHVRLITANGTEIFKSQNIDIKTSNDFHIYTTLTTDKKKNINKAIVALIFYEDKFMIHQWSRTNEGVIYYSKESVNSNQFKKHKSVQMSTNGIFCDTEKGDVNCHKITATFQKGFNTKKFNIQMLQQCKNDTFKLNILNKERYVVSCLNKKNEFVIQLFSSDLKRDFDMNGMMLFKDEKDDSFTYDVLNGKNNELVVIKAELSKNQYFIETFNFIKNSTDVYILCPPGCQDCYWKQQLTLQLSKNSIISDQTLNCSLCKFNSYFADNYADLCFLKKERPKGYEFMEEYHKFSSCDYCCKTNKSDYICDVCLNVEGYEYFVDEPNNGRCDKKCEGNFAFIKKDEKICTNSCTGVPNCITFKNYLNSLNP
jgi:hypothetical protein